MQVTSPVTSTNSTPNTEALTIRPRHAAHMSGLSVRQICRLCERGELPAAKVGHSWLINRAEFMRICGMQA